jgi:hypothetical protein
VPNVAAALSYLSNNKFKWTALYESRDSNTEDSIILQKLNQASMIADVSDPEHDVHDVSSLAIPESEVEDFFASASSSRMSQRMDDSQHLLVAYVWTLNDNLARFQAYPETLQIDGLEKSNKENMVLLTISGKDSRNQMFNVCRAFVPNQKRWVFRYLFEYALPKLVGRDALKYVNLICTDGDSNEIQQLEESMVKYLPNAIRIRCGWHLVDRNLGVEMLSRMKFKVSDQEAKGIRLVSHIF